MSRPIVEGTGAGVAAASHDNQMEIIASRNYLWRAGACARQGRQHASFTVRVFHPRRTLAIILRCCWIWYINIGSLSQPYQTSTKHLVYIMYSYITFQSLVSLFDILFSIYSLELLLVTLEHVIVIHEKFPEG